jgi:muramoyltetrapeptide carboxypeptidase
VTATRQRPARLRAGDRVAIVAPSGPVRPELLDRAVTILTGWGLDVVVGDHVLDKHPTLPYLAGTDTDRAADLQRAWCDPTVSAVVCARGGYGAMRMLDLLDWDAMAAAGPKVFTGASDITALHEAIGAHLGLVTLFAPIVAGVSFDDPAQRHLRETLFEPERQQRLTGPHATALADGVATGILVGGNLSLLSSGLAASTVTAPPDGSIVLLEDVNEPPYQVDRMLTQLLRGGWFTGAAGIALGSWTGCGELVEVRAVVEDLLVGLGLPIVWELGFGHCDGQLTVPLGVPATLDADNATITLAEPALR